MEKIEIRPAQLIDTSTTPDYVYDISGNKVVVPVKENTQIAKDTSDEEKKKRKMYWVIGGAVLIIGIGAYFYFKRKRK